jgi:hypothetical protein
MGLLCGIQGTGRGWAGKCGSRTSAWRNPASRPVGSVLQVFQPGATSVGFCGAKTAERRNEGPPLYGCVGGKCFGKTTESSDSGPPETAAGLGWLSFQGWPPRLVASQARRLGLQSGAFWRPRGCRPGRRQRNESSRNDEKRSRKPRHVSFFKKLCVHSTPTGVSAWGVFWRLAPKIRIDRGK